MWDDGRSSEHPTVALRASGTDRADLPMDEKGWKTGTTSPVRICRRRSADGREGMEDRNDITCEDLSEKILCLCTA